MRTCDVLIVGGGPAGSSCARSLVAAGMDVLVVDRARFPRDKLCAGWVTPAAFAALGLPPAEYAATGAVLQEIRGFATGVLEGPQLETRYESVVSYGVRRCEFDTHLLRRSGAQVVENTPLRGLRRASSGWIVNEEIRAPVIVGAGGHFCPVAAHLGRSSTARMLVVAREAEFRLRSPSSSPIVPELPQLFFCRDIEGYGWCFRKEDYLNVGIGRRTAAGFAAHARAFRQFLIDTHRIEGHESEPWRGHAYILAGGATCEPCADGALLVGDAAGLAVKESGEGIRTAIESGIAAAEVLVAARGHYNVEALRPYMLKVAPRTTRTLASRLADALPVPLVRAAARQLLKSPRFTRDVVVERWFLRQCHC